MTVLDQARDLAARTTDKIDAIEQKVTDAGLPLDAVLYRHTADRENVAYFLRAIERAEEGRRACWLPLYKDYGDMAHHAARYTEARDEAWQGLKRIGSLYGVTA